MTIEDAATEVLISQLEIARQSLEEKNRQILELQKKVELLEGMLNRVSAQRFGPLPQPLPSIRSNPRRWAVR